MSLALKVLGYAAAAIVSLSLFISLSCKIYYLYYPPKWKFWQPEHETKMEDEGGVFYHGCVFRLFGTTWSWIKVPAKPKDKQRVADIEENIRARKLEITTS